MLTAIFKGWLDEVAASNLEECLPPAETSEIFIDPAARAKLKQKEICFCCVSSVNVLE